MPERSGPLLLFVIQQHSATRLHYDFRWNATASLKSWALPNGRHSIPPTNASRCGPKTTLDYASFEGVIPKGQYGAGEVIRLGLGVYSRTRRRPGSRTVRRAESNAGLGRLVAKRQVSVMSARAEKVRATSRWGAQGRQDWLLSKNKKWTGS